MEKPLLSIIIPTYNSAKTIASALQSIVDQNVSGIECLIIDGDSTDETIHIIREYTEKYDFIHFVSEPDKGIYDAMNKGIGLSKGDYLFFLGSDDTLYDNSVLQDVIAVISQYSYDFIYGDVVFKYNRIRVGEETNYLKLLKDLNNICHQAIFYSRKVFDKLGNYSLLYPIYADFHMNIRCFRDENISKKYIHRIISVFNEKGSSHFKRSQDRFLITTHEEYVSAYEDPVALYDSVLFLEKKAETLLNSKEYRLGKRIGNIFRSMKALFGKRPKEVNTL